MRLTRATRATLAAASGPGRSSFRQHIAHIIDVGIEELDEPVRWRDRGEFRVVATTKTQWS
jgi:hypothetical protein